MEILNETEKILVQQFYENEMMREAVKKVLLQAVYSDGVLKPGEPADPLQNRLIAWLSNNLEQPDSIIGANIRATYWGLNALTVGFNKLAEYKKVEPKQDKLNKAR